MPNHLTLEEQFALDSNRIEGEGSITDNQTEAVHFIKELSQEEGELTLRDLKMLHSLCFNHLKADWVGKWRDCQVFIGKHIPPAAIKVPELMEEYIKALPFYGSWEAHNTFEAIHPFQDGNGRLGRLIWLYKALREGEYDFSISFIHKYYYQTLDHLNK